MMRALDEAYKLDVEYRTKESGTPRSPGLDFNFTDIDPASVADGRILYEKNGVKITTFEVLHGPVVPAIGFTFEYDGFKVMLSGDTTYTENLVKFGQGADVVMLEVLPPALLDFIFQSSGGNQDVLNAVQGRHLVAAQAASIFNETRPTLGVYYHTGDEPANNETLLTETAKFYDGPVFKSRDLTQIRVHNNFISVRDLSVCPKKFRSRLYHRRS